MQLGRRRGPARTRRPRTGRARPSIPPPRRAACSSVDATPPAMLAPARLCTSATPGALEHRGGHRRRRRLAVGGRDDGAPVGQARRQPLDRVAAPAASAPCRAGSCRRHARPVGPARRRRGRRRSWRPACSCRVAGMRHRRRRGWPAGSSGRRAGSTPDRHRQLGDRVAVGVQGERARARRSRRWRARTHLDAGAGRTCSPRNTVGSSVRNRSLGMLWMITRSSRPSSSRASGASSIPPP